MTRALERLLRPRSVAVIGGGAWCGNVIRECRKIGFAGDIWPVHRTRAEFAGLKAYASVSELPDAPDASFVGVNRAATVDIVGQLAARGAGGAVCFASGFREAEQELADAADLQARLIAEAGQVAFLGPNCYGFINAFDGVALWPDQHGLTRVERGVALVTQSSNIALNLTMQTRALPIGYLITVGNQAQTSLAEASLAALEDPRVTALGLHIEGFGDLDAFTRLAERARALRKPIVALKVGATAQAQAGVVSHTAALIGGQAGAEALLDRLGVGRVASLSALMEALKLLHVVGPLTSDRIASMSCSGGEASLMADSPLTLPKDASICYPPLNDAQRAALRQALGPKVALANPLDYHTYIWNDRAAMAECFGALMDPSLALGCVVLDFPRADRCARREWDAVVDAAEDARAARGVPMAILASITDTMPEDVAQAIMARGLAAMAGIPESLEAISAAARIGAAWRAPPPAPVLRPSARRPASSADAQRLSEPQAKALLAAGGVDIPQGARAHSIRQAVAAAGEIGFPVVLKGVGAAHKTEAGLVALGLKDAQAVETAARAMRADQFLVEEMIEGAVAELIVGVVREPAHGFVLTLGAGGVLTELLQDARALLVPARAVEIAAALEHLRIARILDGYRGAPPADRGAVVHAVAAIQRIVAAHADRLVELEINPLICTQTRAVAADALITLDAPNAEESDD